MALTEGNMERGRGTQTGFAPPNRRKVQSGQLRNDCATCRQRLFNHLIGAHAQCHRHREAERLGGL
jgi:hypothetical protein